MTPQEAYKAVGQNPCNSCPEYERAKPCQKRDECESWKKYCFRRRIVAAARKQDQYNVYAINRSRYTFKVRKENKK